MKKILALTFILFAFSNLFSQAPEKMSYQSVIRDNSNELVKNQFIGMQISVLKGSATGTAVYVEALSTNTNANGLISIQIGANTAILGDFSAIDWSDDTYFIKTEVDPTGGTTFTITGVSQFLSVPYALYAKTSGDASLKYLGAVRSKNLGSPNPNSNNEIPNLTSTAIRWLGGPSENYKSSLGGTNNTEITIPTGVKYIKIHCSIIYDQVLTTTDSKSQLFVNKNGNPFSGLSNSGFNTYQYFNSFYGLTFSTSFIEVSSGDVFDIKLFQNSGESLYLAWGSVSSSLSVEFYDE
ncbi:hypothetical protein ACXGQW_00245 [Wenyingzhuangia sp. IMCC45533]